MWENCRIIFFIQNKVERNCNSNKGSEKVWIFGKKICGLQTLFASLTELTTTSIIYKLFLAEMFYFLFCCKRCNQTIPSTCLFVNTKPRHFTGFESALLFVRTLLYSFFFYLERLNQLYDSRIQLCLLMNKKSF